MRYVMLFCMIKEREGEVKGLGIISSNFLSPQSCLGLASIAP